jgi:hypothetical protein
VSKLVRNVPIVNSLEMSPGRCLWTLCETRLRVLQGAVGAFWASTAPGVPSMFDSLEVKVLCPGPVRQRASEAQGRPSRGAV